MCKLKPNLQTYAANIKYGKAKTQKGLSTQIKGKKFKNRHKRDN